jgi:hypothetical protein
MVTGTLACSRPAIKSNQDPDKRGYRKQAQPDAPRPFWQEWQDKVKVGVGVHEYGFGFGFPISVVLLVIHAGVPRLLGVKCLLPITAWSSVVVLRCCYYYITSFSAV